MRSTRRLLAAYREVWERARRHPFFQRLEGPGAAGGLRRWLALEQRWFERTLASLGCLLAEVPKTHRYVLAQALMLIAEELDWMDVHVDPTPLGDELAEVLAEVDRVFRQGPEQAVVVLWLGARLQYEALRPIQPVDELARVYWERRTAPVIEAFLHDFEELAEGSVEALGLGKAGELLLDVVKGQTALWDLGLTLFD